MQRVFVLPITAAMILLNLFMPAIAHANLFRITPYAVINHKNEFVLKFKLKKTTKLNIIISERNSQGVLTEKSKIEKDYRASELFDVNAGAVPCGSSLHYSFTASSNFSYEIPGVKCDKNENLVFGFLADTQENVGHPQVAAVIDSLVPQKMNFLINGGDVVNFGARSSEWVNHFAVANSYYSKIPVVAAIGNHEYWYSWTKNGTSALFRDYLRSEGDSRSGEIHLRFPQVDILVFNTNFKWVSQDGQWEWLEKSLLETRQNNKKAIVVMHHSPFTSGKDRGAMRGSTLRNKLVPMLEKSGNVVMVLSGHEHIYERSMKNQIQYVVAGPAGGGRYTAVSSNPYRQYVNSSARTFSLFKMSEKNLEMTTYDNDRSVIDQFNIPLN